MNGLRDVALALTAVLAALAAPTAHAHAQQDVPAGALRSGTLSFVGHSTAGGFGGTTASVTGGVDGGTELATAHGWAEAAVESLRTGNGLRDRHLREALEATRYRTIRFELRGVRAGVGTLADTASVTLLGAMTIHGVTHELEVPATLVRQTGTVRVTSTFPLRLHDYGIKSPRQMLGLLRVSDDIQVRADLTFITGIPAAASAEPRR